MPRTKVQKTKNKRALDNASEIEDILRDFDIEYENSLHQIRRLQQQNMDDIDAEFESMKKRLDPNILQMTMGELKKYKTFDEITLQQNLNMMNNTVKETFNKTIQKIDDGYSTGEASNKSQCTDSEHEIPSTAHKPKVSTISVLKSFGKSRRRSQSQSNIPANSTPGPRAMMNMKLKTPNVKDMVSSTHMSRPKFRTPLTHQQPQRHVRAASADRVESIIPKVNPNAPVAVLRHAKPGEAAFSVTGSPIVASQGPGITVNMNIPYENGILQIRPKPIDPALLDSTMINNVVGNSIQDMRALKNALDVLVSNYERRNRH